MKAETVPFELVYSEDGANRKYGCDKHLAADPLADPVDPCFIDCKTEKAQIIRDPGDRNLLDTEDDLYTDNNKQALLCFLCEESFVAKSNLEHHMTSHSTESFLECPDCGDVYRQFPLFISHINDKHAAGIVLELSGKDNEAPPYSPLQDKQLDEAEQEDNGTDENVFSDLHNNEPEQDSDDWPEEETLSNSSPKRPEGKYHCELCDAKFVFKNMLKRHNRAVHAGINKEEFLEDMTDSDDTTTNKLYSCDYCGAEYSHKASLTAHIKTHIAITVTQVEVGRICTACNLHFGSEAQFKQHVKTIHPPPMKVFTCENCKKTFKRSGDLRKHERIHNGVKPFVCECGKAFTHQTSLRHHQLTHNDDSQKKFVCSYCGMGFNYAGNLKVHIRKHTGDKPYKCKICFRDFNRSANLNDHMHIHLELKTHHCRVCEKSFTSSSALSKHKKIHLGVRDYACRVCDKSFLTQTQLVSHNRLHSNEKQYRCRDCGKEFRRYDTQRNHEKMHEETEQYATSSTNETSHLVSNQQEVPSDLIQDQASYQAPPLTSDYTIEAQAQPYSVQPMINYESSVYLPPMIEDPRYLTSVLPSPTSGSMQPYPVPGPMPSYPQDPGYYGYPSTSAAPPYHQYPPPTMPPLYNWIPSSDPPPYSHS